MLYTMIAYHGKRSPRPQITYRSQDINQDIIHHTPRLLPEQLLGEVGMKEIIRLYQDGKVLSLFHIGV
jgi:hypothetical protein